MVLQQNRSMRIWGTAEPEEGLTVTFAERAVKTTADKAGNWSTVIETGSAGGPYQLTIAADDESRKVVFDNVLVGEVWLCCGQGNMQMKVRDSENAKSAVDSAKSFPQLRMFTAEQHATSTPIKDFVKVKPWYCCSEETINEFSAVAFYFGRHLQESIRVPIGVINVARAGTTLEAWTPYEGLENEGSFDGLLEHWKERDDPSNPSCVSCSFNGMIAPLTRFPVAGIIWYQGEANVGRGAQYARMFPTMIRSWREQFKSPDLPFYFVQLAPHRYEDYPRDALAEIWEAQLKTQESVPHTGIVPTIDVGDPGSLIPSNKLTIGRRLSRLAIANRYAKEETGLPTEPEPAAVPADEPTVGGPSADSADLTNSADIADSDAPSASDNGQTTEGSSGDSETTVVTREAEWVVSGPKFQSAKVDGDQIVITFRNTGSGLVLHPEHKQQFTICDEDRQFVPADVTIDGPNGTRLILRNKDITQPVAARYAWQDTAKSALSNKEGLPAFPFRTDDFPLISSEVEF